MGKIFLSSQDNKSSITVDLGEGKSISLLSLLPIPITQRRNGKTIGYGTGFLARPTKESPSLLVTNYHVLTGREPTSPSSMLDGYPDSPDELEFPLPIFKNNRLSWSHGIAENIATKDSKFMEHRDRGKGIDLAAIPLRFPEDAVPVHLDQLPLRDDVELEIGGDAFIIGFPFPVDLTPGMVAPFPIWKRASIASESAFPLDGLPKIFVDSASRPGMSGSPVFIRAMNESYSFTEDQVRMYKAIEEGTASATEFLGSLTPEQMKPDRVSEYRFVGVYAGRFGIPAEKDLQLGVVWSAQALREMLENPVMASHPFPVGR